MKLKEGCTPFIATKLAGGPLMALQLHPHTCEPADTLLQHPTLCSRELTKEAPQVNGRTVLINTHLKGQDLVVSSGQTFLF